MSFVLLKGEAVNLTPIIYLITGLLLCAGLLRAQAKPGARRFLDLQVGGIFQRASPDYGQAPLRGLGLYSTVDWQRHLGVEVSLHALLDGDSQRKIRMRTFEVGPRYAFHFGPWSPYGKLLYGRGDFRFPPVAGYRQSGPAAQLAYNFWAIGGGLDYALRPSINLRFDYEHQQWGGFPPHGLSPQTFGFGVAYHFR